MSSTAKFGLLARTVKRHLFSSEILGVENFKRIRTFEKDRLNSKSDFVEQLTTRSLAIAIPDRRVVVDLIKLIYITENKQEVSLITALLKQLYCNQAEVQDYPTTQKGVLIANGPLSPTRFQFGPLLFRLLYILEDPSTAQLLYCDKDLKSLFRSTTCHLLLMDMLYEQGRYKQVSDTFAMLQHSEVSARFTPDCTTLAMAALYQLNSTASYQEMKHLVEEAKAEGRGLSRRCLLFAASLALKQGDGLCALNIAQSLTSSGEAIFKNIKLMALAHLGRLEEVLISMEEGGRNDSLPNHRCRVLYSDTVQSVTDQFAATSNLELEAKWKLVLSSLETEGLLSPQTVEHFINRPILRQRNAKASQSFKTRSKSPIKIK